MIWSLVVNYHLKMLFARLLNYGLREEMQEYSIILTLETIYDITDIADYIEKEFGQHRADRFQSDIKNQLQSLSHSGTIFPKPNFFTEDILYIKKVSLHL